MEKPRIVDIAKKSLVVVALALTTNLSAQDSLETYINNIVYSWNKQERIDKTLDELESMPNCVIRYKGEDYEPEEFLNEFYNNKEFKKYARVELKAILRRDDKTIVKLKTKHN